jgi:hypothetical protein
MAETYLIDTASVASGDFQEWANLSFDIAVNNVYPGKCLLKDGVKRA